MNLESLRVVIAEPEQATCAQVSRALRQAGAQVWTVETGADALFLCEAKSPDVLITEIHFSDFDGFEVCERIRRELQDIAMTIVVATRPNDEMTKTYLGPMVRFAGGDFFVAKPADPMLIVCLLSDLFPLTEMEQQRPMHPARATWPTSRSFATVGVT